MSEKRKWLIRLSAGLIIFLASCTQAGPGPTPAEVQKLIPVLADLHLVEAMVDELPLDLRDSVRVSWYERVLTDYEMSQATFDSLTWLMRSEPDWITEIYTRVGEELAVREAEGASD